ncbi:hypothetical protein [Halomonas sp. SL1]|uniref:hypothetical protein n=1 Tax=Halomonas sp. SL1 TaxID=2137478 RepID=UPI000D15F866|nr:hypothetical protein [Halomonas sp. SL1]RAH37404.1 hypothetical protein C9J49_010905 [Halomonas sp. SL1]
MAEHDDDTSPEGYTHPLGNDVLLDMGGEYTAPSGDGVALMLVGPPGPYTPPVGDSVALNFSGEYAPPAGDGVGLNLVHAGWEPPEVQEVEVVITSTLAAPVHEARAEAVLPVSVASTLAAPQHRATLASDINVYRDPSLLRASAWEQAGRQSATTASVYRASLQKRRQTATRYQHAEPIRRQARAPARQLPRCGEMRRVVQEYAAPLGSQHGGHNVHLPRLDRFRRLRAEQGRPLPVGTEVLGHYLPHLRTGWGLPYEQASRILAAHWGLGWQAGEYRPLGVRGPYEQAIDPPPGVSVPPEPPEPPEPGGPWEWDGTLEFCARLPASLDLDFAVDPCAPTEPEPPVDVPIQRTYLVSNSASLTLVATGQALEASAISVAIDADSWAWELRATVIGEASLAAVRDAAQPAELEATLNGHTWRVVVDDWQRSRAWGELPAITVSARSLAAYLGAPHAAARSYAETQTRTAQQLAEQELPLGWTLDWQIDDWLVDAGAWHYTNRTPIEAISAIATAAGATVQAHPSEPRLIIAPRYAAPHWAWAGETPDVTLPPDVLTRLGSEYRPSEALNGVYISGETTGVLALVKRTGTAADRLGEMIVDPLTTRQAPARARGIAVLSASGEQTRETLALPVADDIAGLLATGQLIRVGPAGDDWRGLVRGVSLAASVDGNGALTIEQTAELERHLESA